MHQSSQHSHRARICIVLIDSETQTDRARLCAFVLLLQRKRRRHWPDCAAGFAVYASVSRLLIVSHFMSREHGCLSMLIYLHVHMLPVEMSISPIGRNSCVLIGGEPHQNSVFGSFGFCGVKSGFDGLSTVVLVRFPLNFSKPPGISSYERNRTFGRAM
jgi:hypothetical protein